GYVATLWAVEHAAELSIDPERIAVGGDSAGGTLAAIVCQLARQARGVRLAAQLLLCPITDFAADTESRCAFAEGYLLHKATLDRDLEHYIPAGLNPADPCVSPLRAPDFHGLPPAYIHTAEFDPVRDEGRAYSTPMAIRAAGLGEIRSWLALLVKTFQLSDQEILSMIIDGEAAAVHWRARIRSKITGTTVLTELVDVVRVREGRIASYTEFFVPRGG